MDLANAHANCTVVFKLTPDTGKVVYSADVPAFLNKIRQNVEFRVGVDDPADWPVIHPSPEDDYAGNRLYRYKMLFDWKGGTRGLLLLKAKLNGNYFDKSSTKDLVPHLFARFMPRINGREWPWGNRWEKTFSYEMRDWEPNMYYDHTWWATIPSEVLRDGENELTFAVVKGEGLHYKDIELVHYPVGLHIESVESTVFYQYIDGVLHNMMRARILKTEENPETVVFEWKAAGKSGAIEMDLPFGRHEVTFFVPDTGEEAVLVEAQAASGEWSGRFEGRIGLRRKWEVMLNHHTHTDIGYTHLPEDIIHLQNDNMRKALTYCELTEHWPEDSRFVWTVEVSWLIDEFLRAATEEEKQKLKKYIANGQILVQGLYLHMHSDVLNLEELIEHTTWKRLGMRAEAAMATDVPGYTWPLIDVMAQAGIRFFDVTPNFTLSTRSPDITTPQLFWWKSPGGQRKVLTWYNIYHYFDGNELGFVSSLPVAEHNLSNRLDEMERKGFPYAHYLVRVCGQHSDNSPPNLKIAEIVKAWNEKWAYPKVRMGDAAKLLHSAAETYGALIPEVEGDLADWWSDGVGSGAPEMALSRRTQTALQEAKTWGALLDAAGESDYPRETLSEAYRQLLLFDEHTWGFWDCNARAPLHHESIRVKKGYVEQAAKLAEGVRGEQLRKLSARFGAGDGRAAVFNSLSWERRDVVRLPVPDSWRNAAVFEVTDETSGESVPAQVVRSADGAAELWFLASVPALSGKVYRIAPQEGGTAASGSAAGDEEHPYFDVDIDPETGAIRKLHDKRLGVSWIGSGPWGLAQYLRAEFSRAQWGAWGSKLPRPRPEVATTGAARIVEQTHGPIARHIRVNAQAPAARQFTADYWLFADRPVIGVEIALDKEEVDAVEQGYVAFPFEGQASFVYDLALGTVRFPEQLLPASALDHIAVQSWVDMRQQGRGVLIVTHDAPLSQFGRIRTREMGGVKGSFRQLQPHREELPAHFYSYIYNNLWGTNFWPTQGGKMVFRYTIVPYEGRMSVLDANRLGLEQRFPLTGVWLGEASRGESAAADGRAATVPSLIGGVSEIVSLETIEKDESGAFVLRFREIAGVGGEAGFDVKRTVRAAAKTSIDGTERQSLGADNGRIRFAIEPFGLAQIVLHFD
jgi:Glycosyl hydrolases family 38 N-terminal domain./Glycosyl hydrolases family 38 C-terminal domain.